MQEPALTRDEAEQIKATFFSKVGGPSSLLPLLDALEGIHYFIKDEKFRHIAVSEAFAKRLGLSGSNEMIGYTNYQFYPKVIADKFAIDDEYILRTGEPLLQIIEMLPSACGGYDWITTNKLPLRDSRGKVIGIMGTLQSHSTNFQPWAEGSGIGKAVTHIQQHYASAVDIVTLARLAGISPRHLGRMFHDVFAMSPQQFWINTRIQKACDLLQETSYNMSQIAEKLGFCDPSAFTKQFRLRIGISPAQFRDSRR